MPWVRMLIGRQTGQIVEMQFHEAEACLASGTVAAVTAEEAMAAGIDIEGGVKAAKPEEPPPGYRIVECAEVPGFDVIGPPDNVRLNTEVFPNKVQALSFARETEKVRLADVMAERLLRAEELEVEIAEASAALDAAKAKKPADVKGVAAAQQNLDALKADLSELTGQQPGDAVAS